MSEPSRGSGPSPHDVLAPSLRPEPLDIEIIREMYRDGAANLAGVDPRLNATRIAQRLRVGRARISARLRAWNEVGFLRSYDVWLNPALFGWQGAWLNIQVEHRHVKPTLFARLALIEGAVSGLEFLGDWISLGLVTPDTASLERSGDLIRGLAGVHGVEPPVPWRVPEPKRQLTPLDIRIVRALREYPIAALSETARRVGISTRTMTRRYSRLVEDWEVWFVPILDFRALSSPVVGLGLSVKPGTGRGAIVRRIRARYPLTLEFRNSVVGPQLGDDTMVLFVLPSSAAHLEEVEQFVGAIDGVVAFEANVLVRTHSFPAWLDRHLERLARRPT